MGTGPGPGVGTGSPGGVIGGMVIIGQDTESGKSRGRRPSGRLGSTVGGVGVGGEGWVQQSSMAMSGSRTLRSARSELTTVA